MPAIASTDPGQPLHEATPDDEVVDVLARRIRRAQHEGTTDAPVRCAREINAHIQAVIREVREETR